MTALPIEARPGVSSALLVLTKARLNTLVAATVAGGAALAPAGGPPWVVVALAALGATLAGLGACALNQVIERERDARMSRTRARPLPSGRMSPGAAAAFGLGLIALGAALALSAGPTPALLTLLGAALYVVAYTPLKGTTPLAFIPGALSGALPCVVGWSAGGGPLDARALGLVALVVAWQVPHVAAIDFVHRADHARGGLRTLAVLDPTGATSARVALLGALGVVLVGPALTLVGLAPTWAGLVAGALGLPLVALAERFLRDRDQAAARRLFAATLVHLPALLALVIAARRGQ